MRVAELVERLQREDPDALVMVCVDTELGDYMEADGVVRGTTDGDRFQDDAGVERFGDAPLAHRAVEIS